MSDTEEVVVTMVFQVTKSKFREMNPFTTETPWGIPYVVSMGDAVEEADRLREQSEPQP